jgi:carbon-monoxide dehydrogenase large subunit
VYESGDFPRFFERLLDAAPITAIRRELDARRARGETVGLGVAVGVELGAIGPFEDASVVVEPDGTVVVRAGVASLGQGIETALAQIAADELGVDAERVVVHHHDTDEIASGFGSYASRSTVVAGNAVALAARALRERAEAEGVPPGEVGEVAARFEKPHPSFSFGAALSVVSVDRETGVVRSERHVVAHDVGRAVNPALLRGQLTGAAAQGIGAALYEELPYDETGQPLAVSLADYLLPTAVELPPVDAVVIEHPTTGNPLGVKGGGEAGMVTAPAAVANAVADALGEAGVAVDRLPLTPPRVRALLRDAPAQEATEASSPGRFRPIQRAWSAIGVSCTSSPAAAASSASSGCSRSSPTRCCPTRGRSPGSSTIPSTTGWSRSPCS